MLYKKRAKNTSFYLLAAFLFCLLLMSVSACSQNLDYLLDKLNMAEENFLAQPVFSVKAETVIKYQDKTSTQTNCFDRFEYEGKKCFSKTSPTGYGTYYVDDFYYDFNTYSSTYGRPGDIESAIREIAITDYEKSDLSIQRRGDQYVITYHNVDQLFRKMTNNSYYDDSSIKLPSCLKVVETIKDGLFRSEEGSFSFTYKGIKMRCHIKVVYTYESQMALPYAVIKAAEKREEDVLYYNLEKEFVKEISYEGAGEKLSNVKIWSDAPLDYYGLSKDYHYSRSEISYDGTDYLVISTREWSSMSNKLSVYDANSLTLLYYVTFNRPIFHEYVCYKGKIAISLELDERTEFSSQPCIYSLKDFSLISKNTNLSKNNVVLSSIYPKQNANTDESNYDYVLDGDFSLSRVLSGKILNQKYDYVRLEYGYLLDGYKNTKEQYWIYDKDNDAFVAQSYMSCIDYCIINDRYFLGYDESNVIVYIDLLQLIKV